MKGGVDAGGGLDALVCKKLSAFEHARERQKLTVSFALPSIHGSTAIHLSRPLNLIQGEEPKNCEFLKVLRKFPTIHRRLF
jgi:hypothetical protein